MRKFVENNSYVITLFGVCLAFIFYIAFYGL